MTDGLSTVTRKIKITDHYPVITDSGLLSVASSNLQWKCEMREQEHLGLPLEMTLKKVWETLKAAMRDERISSF